MLLENPVQWIGIGSMFRFIVAFLLKTIKFLFFFFIFFCVFIGMEPSVRSPLHSICIVNIDITLLYLYILRVSVQSIVHFLNVHIYYVSLNLPFDSFRTANWKYVFQIITSCFQNRTSCQFFGFFLFFLPHLFHLFYTSRSSGAVASVT